MIIRKSPIYPYWLDIMGGERNENESLDLLYGKVLEVGAGNCAKKEHALKTNSKIKKYIATDYSSWDELFAVQIKTISKFGWLTEALYGNAKDGKKLDNICSALDLPYRNNTFDCFCSFYVLEHIYDPVLFFKEAHRVLKKGGICITAAPFLYREHGGINNDFQRFTRGGYYNLAKTLGFDIISISTYCCFGTTLAILINQYIICKITEGNILTKIVLFPFSPFIFLFVNIIGFILDSVDQDERFAQRYHVVMKKE